MKKKSPKCEDKTQDNPLSLLLRIDDKWIRTYEIFGDCPCLFCKRLDECNLTNCERFYKWVLNNKFARKSGNERVA